MKATLNKIFSVLLAVCFVLSAIPAPAAAAEIPTNAVINGSYNADGVWTEGGDGSITHNIDGTNVTLSKTATPVEGQKNTFDITLQVKTSTTTTTTTKGGAVVLVIDTSNSMDCCSICGGDNNGWFFFQSHDDNCTYKTYTVQSEQTRLYAAKAAARDFLKTYATEDATANRQLAIVAFADGGITKMSWENVAGVGSTGYNTALNTIDGLFTDGGTNMEAGLQEALTQLNKDAVKGIASKSVVLLSDGAPTYRIGGGSGSNGSQSNNNAAKNKADSIKGTGATLYTVCYGAAEEYTYYGGPTVGEFLSGSIATSPSNSYNVNNASALKNAFSNIVEQITEGLDGKGLEVIDPMADMIAVSVPGDGFTASEGNTYTWTLGEHEDKVDGDTTKHIYTHTYRVTLDVEDPDFVEGQFFPTNKPTYLTINNTPYYFPVPGVTGVLPRTDVTVTKVWDDNDNQDDIRLPVTVELQEKVNGTWEKVAEATLTTDDNNTYTWSGTQYDLTAKKEYRVVETNVPAGYTSVVTGNAQNGFTVTNTHAPEMITISGEKTWNDNDNQDGIRPTSITVNLMDGKDIVDTAEVKADDNGHWTYKFENLPKYRAGKVGEQIVYTVKEAPVTGYNASYEGSNITNTHTPETTSVTVTKVWDDTQNQDGKRPQSIIINLLAGGQETDESVTLSEENKWTHTFTGLDKYADGELIEYTVTEDAVTDYTANIVNNNDGTFTITNTHTPETTSVTVTKKWDHKDNEEDKLPVEVTVRLKANNVDKKVIKLNEENKWTYTFENLPEYEAGKPISYTVTEDAVTDYTTNIEKDENGSFIITNTYKPDKISITFTKAWEDANNQDGKRPDKINVELLADGKKVKTIELTAKDEWTTKIDIKKMSGGKDIVYTIKEVAVEGYTSVITGDQNKGFTITNTHEPEMIDKIVGQKIWDDGNNQDGKRPESITVKLKANGDVIKTVTVTAENNWFYTFENLPKFDNGEEIAYTVEEAAVEGYKTSYDGYKITNTYSPEEINIKVTKSWVDSNDADKIRPTKVTIYLLANGEKTGDKLVLTAGEKWTGSFTDLPKYKDGKVIKYTIEEKAVKDYKAVIKGTAEDGFTVTNSHTTIPKTGDERTPILWISMMALGIIAVFFATRPFFVKKGKYSR